MAQIQKGTTYSTGDQVTAANLNALADAAILLPGAITDQTAKTVPLAADTVLIHSAADTALRKSTLTQLFSNATGIPISTGISGLGTGIATALAINTGTTGAPALLGSASAFTTLSASGTTTVGPNNTGTGLALLQLLGGSGTNGGASVYFGTNGTAYSSIGQSSGILGGTTTDFVIYANNSGQSIKFYAGGAGLVGAISNTGIAVTGALSSTGGANFATASGNVGIGTSSPAYKLSISAGTVTGGIFVQDSDSSNASPVIRVQGNRNDNNSSQSFSGGLVLERYNSNGSSGLVSGNTLGTIYFGGNYNTTPTYTYPASISAIADANWSSTSAASTALAFFTGSTGQALATANVNFGTERMRIDSSGNVGIGTSSPSAKLDVKGLVRSSIGTGTGAGGAAYAFYQFGTSATATENWHIGTEGDGSFRFYNQGFGAGLELMRLTSTGLAVTGNLTVGVSGTGTNIVIREYSAGTQRNWGIRDDAGVDRLRFSRGASDYWFWDSLKVAGSDNVDVQNWRAVSGFNWTVSSTIRTSINSTGLAVTGALSCTGALSKGSGSFRIEHPLPEKSATHQLVHSFIEGPQADLIYRGKVTLIDGKASVNIDAAATMSEGTFEVLCREVQCFTTNETGWTAVRGKVTGNILTIEAKDADCVDEISWMVIGERQDPHMMETDWTDDNGKVIVEPLKPSIESN